MARRLDISHMLGGYAYGWKYFMLMLSEILRTLQLIMHLHQIAYPGYNYKMQQY